VSLCLWDDAVRAITVSSLCVQIAPKATFSS
jgi:hypothetical protein